LKSEREREARSAALWDGDACLMEGRIDMAAQAQADEPFQGRIRQGHEEGEEADPGSSGRDRYGPLHGPPPAQ
jgi:hypothetical protein